MADQPWTTHWVTDPKKAGPSYPARDMLTRWPRRPGAAAIRACSTTRRSTAGTPARIRAGSTPRIRAREYMFLDDTACNLASINLMKFRQRRRHVRRRAVPGGLPAGLHRPGNPGRSRQLSDAADRRQQPSLPAAGAGLFEPGQPDHGQRRCPTIRTRPAGCAAR